VIRESGFSLIRDPIRVPRISENYHPVPRIREIGSLQVHTGYLTFSLKKPWGVFPNMGVARGGNEDKALPDFEILYFPINFLAEKNFSRSFELVI